MNFYLIQAQALFQYGGISRHPLVSGLDPEIRDGVAKRFCHRPEAEGRTAFTYLRIPKSANSTTVRTLSFHAFGQPGIEGDPSGSKAKSRLRYLPSPAAFAESFSFTFVRDPASRVLSAYHDKVHNPAWLRKFGLTDPSDPTKPVTFSAFLERLESGLLHKDLHWIPQSAMIPDDGRDFTFIGRVENIDADMRKAMTAIFGRFDGIVNKEINRFDSGTLAKSEISPEDRRRIERLYARDYELYYG